MHEDDQLTATRGNSDCNSDVMFIYFFIDPLLISSGGVYSGKILFGTELCNKLKLYLLLFIVESQNGGIFLLNLYFMVNII